MIYSVTGNLRSIDFGAAGVNEILQNVAFILGTVAFSCPLNRDFAYSPDLDSPYPVAIARTRARLVEAIQTYEPRAEVTEVEFTGDPLNGHLTPMVKVRIVDDAI